MTSEARLGTSRFSVLVADDEPLARDMVASLLERDPEVNVVAQCADGKSALDALRRTRAQIALLDVEMPELTGVQVVGSLAPDEMPAVVFVTAFDEYAIRAFELAAIDYLVKPFRDDRLFEALERAKRHVREQRLHELAGKVAALSAALAGAEAAPSHEPGPYLARISARSGESTVILRTAELLWIEADDYYVRLHSARGRFLLRASLAALEQQLDPHRFLRVHRTAIVNLDEVREVRPSGGGTCTLVLSDGAELAVSRSRRQRVEEALPLRRPFR